MLALAVSQVITYVILGSPSIDYIRDACQQLYLWFDHILIGAVEQSEDDAELIRGGEVRPMLAFVDGCLYLLALDMEDGLGLAVEAAFHDLPVVGAFRVKDDGQLDVGVGIDESALGQKFLQFGGEVFQRIDELQFLGVLFLVQLRGYKVGG